MIENWEAKWIWAKEHCETQNFYMYARKEFEVNGFGTARALVTCSTEYKLYANGRFVGRGPSPCHPGFQYYDEYDITHHLRPGKNVIAALCYNYGVGTHNRPQAPGAFLLQAEISYGNGNGGGETMIVATDETWRVKPGEEWDSDSARMFWTIGFQEIYDSRKKPVGWNVAGFRDAEWERPFVVGGVGTEPWTQLIPREIPFLREIDICPEKVLKTGLVERVDDPDLDVATRVYREPYIEKTGVIRYPACMLSLSAEAAVVEPGQDKFVVLDFGREVVGYPTIKIRDGGCAVVDMAYSEALDDKEKVHPTRQGILQADRLILHRGRQEWQTFGRRAFRYMQLTFRDISSPLYIESIFINRIGYPVEQVSTFECSDDLLNDIWRIGVYTLSVCMQDAFEDCPLREHGQYPGDARVQALMNYYCYFDKALAAKALRQFTQSQREDGLFNALWPSSTNHILPDYNLVWVMMLHDYYLYTGDASLVEQLYPNLRLLMEDWVVSQESEHGLLTWEPKKDVPGHEWWLFIDHAGLDKHGEVAAYNAFYYQALRDAVKLAAAIGKHEESLRWHARAENVLYRFNERFWSAEKGAYIDCNVDGKLSDTVSVQTNTLALLFGLANAVRTGSISAYLVSDSPRVESSGPYFNFYVLQAMARQNMAREALDLIRGDWGEMLRRGATTWWETFSRDWAPGAVCPDSLCHAWSGAPAYFLPAEILGVRPTLPESGVVAIQPRVGGLQWAKGRIRTTAGDVEVEWHRERGSFRIDIDAPGGFIVALPIEGFQCPQIEEIDLSPETPERRARRTYGWGNTIWRAGEERDPYVDWLHSQEVEPPDNYRRRQRLTIDEDYIWVRESAGTHMRYEITEGPQF